MSELLQIVVYVTISVVACFFGLLYLCKRIFFINKDEQLIVEGLTETYIVNGPKTFFAPILVNSLEKKKVMTLTKSQYCVVKNILSGERHVELGPKLVFLKPYEYIEYDANAVKKRETLSLKANQYVRFLDKTTGAVRIERGERGGVYLYPDEVLMDRGILDAIDLRAYEYARIRDEKTGMIRTEVGEQVLYLNEFDVLVEKKTLISLKANEYVRFLNKTTGKLRIEYGEKGVFPLPEETLLDGDKLQAINLRIFEYVKVMNKKTGSVRTERGEKLVFLGEFDVMVGGKKTAIEIDDETAVLVRDKSSGQCRLVTENSLYVPADDEEIVEVRKLIRLAEYQACIVRDKNGQEHYYYGSNANQRSFFLPPYSELVSLWWSRGRRRERRDLEIKMIDLRPMYMSFEFNCRTNDNVELILEGSFFWELKDLKAMMAFTNDTTGDICNHARSRFIEQISRVTLQKFMTSFNELAQDVYSKDESKFYLERGVKIHSLEVTAYRCAEPR